MSESEAAKDFWGDPREVTYHDMNLSQLAVFILDAQGALGNETVVRVIIANEDLLDIVRSNNGRLSRQGGELEEEMRDLMKRMKGEDR